MKLGFVQWPEGLEANTAEWIKISDQVRNAALDILVTNELPFGEWLARSNVYNRDLAALSIASHEAGLAALKALLVPLIISSRPVWSGDRMANEAFALEKGVYRFLHQKHFFPAEPGWYETSWFRNGTPGFEVAEVGGVRVGVLLCTEMMFNERARRYGRDGAELLVMPRASGTEVESWKTAGKMAALVSGCYAVSTNRSGPCKDGPDFGGCGFACLPDGRLIATTSEEQSLVVVEIDPELARRQKSKYPCYVDEGL